MSGHPTTIAFLGDVYLGQSPSVSLHPDVMTVLNSADLVVGNQEGPITDCDRAAEGKICLKSALESGGILRDWGIHVVSLANNHMFDYGWEGFKQTRHVLDQAGVSYLGAGENLTEAAKPLVLELRGTRVGLLAYSWEAVQTTCAAHDSHGCAPLDVALMEGQIRKLTPSVDAVIVIPHWGYCEYLLPPPEMVSLGNRLVEAGATAVVGHHSHVTQGVVERPKALIAYSLGNFTFAGYSYLGHRFPLTRDNREGLVLTLCVQSGNVVSHSLDFTVQGDGLVRLNNTKRRQKEHARRTALVAVPDYAVAWRKYLRRRMVRRLLYWANFLNWRRVNRMTLVAAWQMVKGIFGLRQ